ncbi:MAG: prephenate dehydratase [Gammaproteobacteria bacterium]
MDTKKLKALRDKIDKLDDGIVVLLARRAEAAAEVGKVKDAAARKQNGKSITSQTKTGANKDAAKATGESAKAVSESGESRTSALGKHSAPAREAQILRRISAKGGKLGKRAMTAIYREIIAACLSCESRQHIAYLGPPGTFSHQAARAFYGDAADFVPHVSIADAVRETEKDQCHFAMVPLENSTGGTVGETVDALCTTPLAVCGEMMMRVRHCLLSRAPDAKDVREIHGHPQALEQCRRWLAVNMPKAQTRHSGSTAAAAQLAAKTPRAAAIGSASAAELYQLPVLAADIEDSALNTTRFLILGRPAALPQTGNDKTSLIMSVREVAGAMHHLLEPFAKHGINMSKLESRPSRGQMWKYIFLTDIEGHLLDAPVAAALEEVRRRAAFVKILGSYPKAAS